MPVLPDKFSLRGTSVPVNGRGIAAINSETPLADAGKRFGAAIAGLGDTLGKSKPSEEARAASLAAKAVQTAQQDFDASPDPDQAGINAAEYLEQSKSKVIAGLSAEAQQRMAPRLDAIFAAGSAQLAQRLETRKREGRIAEVETLFPELTAQHAALADPMARQEIGAALFGSVDRLREAGDIDEGRAQAMKLDLQRQLVRADVLAQPAPWQIEHMRPGKDGESRWFRDTLGAEDADFLHAQAAQQERNEKREAGTQELLRRFGSSAEGEAKALAEIDKQADPGLKQLYLGKLQTLRLQERRALAASAGKAYQLAIEGRESEIDPADRLRLHKARQMEGLLEAAKYARSAPYKGDLLFKERYLAMGAGERACYGVAELAKRLSREDFLEVMQGASGDIDEGQRSRMQSFVQAVTPMLRSVTVGQYATPPENERDRRLLELIHDDANVLVADEEKKSGRPLTATEYQSVMRSAADLALLHSVGLEGGDSDGAIRGAPAWTGGLNDGSGMPPATSAGYNVAALDETDASSDSDPQAYLTNAAQTDDPDTEEGDGDGEPGTLLAQRGSGRRPTGSGGRSLSTEEILRLDSFNRATQRITAHKRDYTELRPNDFVPTPRQLERQELQANAVEFFAARNIELSTHAMFRFGERDNRVTLPDALRAYNTGRLYYDIKYRTYIRYDVQTGVWVSTSAPRGGQILTVAQGNNPSPRWQPVPYR